MRFLVLPTLVAAITLHDTKIADACGCFSPPVSESDYAINQSAEQIIFEVEPGWVTAHVLIRYAGDPSQFAWIVPVPEVPELGISPSTAFGLLDRATAPITSFNTSDICPKSEWACFFEGQIQSGCTPGPAAAPSGTAGHFEDDGGTSADAGATMPPPVDVIDEKVVGDYTTVTFRASEATAAVQWLRSNGFVVNATTSIYMEPYIQENMVFVAAKLVPGAGARAIKPLKMRYRAAFPSVPLVITAVAAQPHLTVTSFIYGAQVFQAMSHPTVQLDAKRLALDPTGRNNYPMLLARTIDEAGGDGFVNEYRGGSAVVSIGSPVCCGMTDTCNLGHNQQCECPGSEFDAEDCAAQPDLVESYALLKALATKYPKLSRITTRISPEEMTFDPAYAPVDSPYTDRVQLTNTQISLASCSDAVVDQAAYRAIRAREGCAAMYCGAGSECVVTEQGPACACAENTVAQQFTDLDGKPSVTCVPRVPTVDLRAGGDALPDACANVSCNGTCIDRNGIAVCACDSGMAATTSTSAPRCAQIVESTHTPGAQSFNAALEELDVCAPPPPNCSPGAKYMRVQTSRVGTNCGNANPPEDMITEDGLQREGCCQGTPPLRFFGGSLLVLAVLLRPRGGRRGRGRPGATPARAPRPS